MTSGTISTKDPPFPAETNSQSPGLSEGPPLMASSQGLSWAISSVPTKQGRVLLPGGDLAPASEPSLGVGEGPGNSRGALASHSPHL